MPPKDPLNAISIIDNKDMEKPKDQMHKPSEPSEPLVPHKSYVASFIYEIDGAGFHEAFVVWLLHSHHFLGLVVILRSIFVSN